MWARFRCATTKGRGGIQGWSLAVLLAFSFAAQAAWAEGTPAGASTWRLSIPGGESVDYGAAPAVPDGAWSPLLSKAVETVFGPAPPGEPGTFSEDNADALKIIAASKDPRLGWLVTDLLRIVSDQRYRAELTRSASALLGIDAPASRPWKTFYDHLIAWDTPPPPDYLRYKRNVLLRIEPAWARLLTEGPEPIDWRLVTWGNVRMDERPYRKTDWPCNCIPAADDPPVTSADAAGWLADDEVVFGIVVNGESRAYPRRIMEVREMVNDRLGGQPLGIPYCSLCGAAQAFVTGTPGTDEPLILRTSGLLSRSNKVMFELNSYSMFDTFRGRAINGPLAREGKGTTLRQLPVVTTTWGQWKRDYPDTTVLAESVALGRHFDFRNTRDAHGPVYPTGSIDPRLPVHAEVLGVITASGQPVAFHVQSARTALGYGDEVGYDGVRLALNGGGVVAMNEAGEPVAAHQAFWFAWSQFYPATVLWPARH